MSADNWTQCPVCRRQATADTAFLLAKANDSYGKVPAEQYRDMIDRAEKPVELDDTLREDFEVGIRHGYFYVSYTAQCSKCGFSFEHNFKDANIEAARS